MEIIGWKGNKNVPKIEPVPDIRACQRHQTSEELAPDICLICMCSGKTFNRCQLTIEPVPVDYLPGWFLADSSPVLGSLS